MTTVCTQTWAGAEHNILFWLYWKCFHISQILLTMLSYFTNSTDFSHPPIFHFLVTNLLQFQFPGTCQASGRQVFRLEKSFTSEFLPAIARAGEPTKKVFKILKKKTKKKQTIWYAKADLLASSILFNKKHFNPSGAIFLLFYFFMYQSAVHLSTDGVLKRKLWGHGGRSNQITSH